MPFAKLVQALLEKRKMEKLPPMTKFTAPMIPQELKRRDREDKRAAAIHKQEAGSQAFRVFGTPNRKSQIIFWLIWIAIYFGIWYFNPIKAIPYPSEVLHAFSRLFAASGMANILYNIKVTLLLNIYATAFATIIALVVAYLGVLPMFRPLTRFMQVLRYIPIVGFTLIFYSIFNIGLWMKVAMLTTGLAFFFITSMNEVIERVPRMKYELAKSLGYNDLQIFYTVIVRPTMPSILDVIMMNSAMGWLMVIAVETFNRTEGGIGAQIYAFTATNQLPEVYAYLIVIGTIAVIWDLVFRTAKRLLFKYSTMSERA